jgi:hypothetical protein
MLYTFVSCSCFLLFSQFILLGFMSAPFVHDMHRGLEKQLEFGAVLYCLPNVSGKA